MNCRLCGSALTSLLVVDNVIGACLPCVKFLIEQAVAEHDDKVRAKQAVMDKQEARECKLGDGARTPYAGAISQGSASGQTSQQDPLIELKLKRLANSVIDLGTCIERLMSILKSVYPITGHYHLENALEDICDLVDGAKDRVG